MSESLKKTGRAPGRPRAAPAVPGGDLALLAEADAQRLCLALMKRFRAPVPGVRISEVRVGGFTPDQIRVCFLRLCANRILQAGTVVDVDGERFRGQLVGLTRFGSALLNSTYFSALAGTGCDALVIDWLK